MKLTYDQHEFLSLMKAVGWSAAEVARRTGLTPAAVSKIVNGKNKPRAGLPLLREAIETFRRESGGVPEGNGNVAVGSSSSQPATEDNSPDALKETFDDLRKIAQADPEKLKTLQSIITTYKKSVKGKK